MAQIVYANIQSVTDFNSANWIESNADDYASVKRQALFAAQRRDIVVIGRRDTCGRVEPRMFCRVEEDGSSRLPPQRWHDIGLRELRIAAAIVGGSEMPASDAASLVASEVGINKPWAPWNETHTAILKVAAIIDALAGSFSDKTFREMGNAYNAAHA